MSAHTISPEAEARREAARTGGKFGAQQRSAPRADVLSDNSIDIEPTWDEVVAENRAVAGFVNQWRATRLTPSEAVEWAEAGFTAAEADRWHHDFFDAKDAADWNKLCSRHDALAYRENGFTTETAADWIGRGHPTPPRTVGEQSVEAQPTDFTAADMNRIRTKNPDLHLKLPASEPTYSVSNLDRAAEDDAYDQKKAADADAAAYKRHQKRFEKSLRRTDYQARQDLIEENGMTDQDFENYQEGRTDIFGMSRSWNGFGGGD